MLIDWSSMKYMFLVVDIQPTKIPFDVLWSNLAVPYPGFLAYTLEPKVHRLDSFGLVPMSTSKCDFLI